MAVAAVRALMPSINDYPLPQPDVRRSSEIRAAWGSPPPLSVPRTEFEHWDGTIIPGGVHEDILEAIRRLDEVLRVHRYNLNQVGDDWCWNRRRIGDSTRWSLHSWAISIDLNATTNPRSKRFVTDMTPQMVADIQAIKHRGRSVWAWGGQWGRHSGYSFDPMHWQINLTPAEARQMRPDPLRPDPSAPADQPMPGGVPANAIVESLIARVDKLEADNFALKAVIGGAPTGRKVEWALRSLTGRAVTPDELAEGLAAIGDGSRSTSEAVAKLQEVASRWR